MLSNLAMLRKKHKLSQKELAQKFNVNQNTVSRWENGDRQIDLETLKALSIFSVLVLISCWVKTATNLLHPICRKMLMSFWLYMARWTINLKYVFWVLHMLC